MTGRIPTTVITGFLGAGKTTMIRHLVENVSGRRLALMINEFGDLGVDGSILEGCGIEECEEGGIIELSNGCICCAVAEEFTPAMLSLLECREPPEHILIETSGLALPQPLIRAFNWPQLCTRVTVDGVIVVIDGPALTEGRFAHDHEAVERQRKADASLDHETPIIELFEDQLASADIVIINKSDLMTSDEIKSAIHDLSGRIQASTAIIPSQHGEVSPKHILGIGAFAEDSTKQRAEIHHAHHGSDHDHDEFESFIVELPEATSAKRLAAGIREVMKQNQILRIKGFAAVKNRPMRLVIQAVGSRVSSYFDKPLREQSTRLVVIGFAGMDQTGIIRSLSRATEA